MLEFQNAVIGQGTFRLGVDWKVSKGDHLSVIGPSGAGKSTLLAGLAGFADVISGHIVWDGSNMADRPDQRPIAMLFQDHNLFPHLNIAQNVALGIKPSLRLSAREKDQVSEALSDVGLAGFEGRKPAELSGGQQSRAALARVLVQARPIILLDEPFSALGPAMRTEMLDLVKTLASRLGAILMMVTHDPVDARRLGGKAVFVADGVAHAPMSVEALLDNPPAELAAYLGS
ncbi:MAG: ATP-binding cassette domain-containing protein [Aliishimia sp.]